MDTYRRDTKKENLDTVNLISEPLQNLKSILICGGISTESWMKRIECGLIFIAADAKRRRFVLAFFF